MFINVISQLTQEVQLCRGTSPVSPGMTGRGKGDKIIKVCWLPLISDSQQILIF